MSKRRPYRAIRLLLFLAVLTLLCGSVAYAALLLSGGNPGGADIGPGHPSLNAAERLALAAYLQVRAGDLSKIAGADPAPIAFEVTAGETASGVATRLAQVGLITDAELLAYYLRYNGLDSQIEAGHFVLKRTMTLAEIANTLGHATPNSATLRVIEGWRAEQIAAALQPAGMNIGPGEFLDLLSARPEQFSFVASLPGDRGLEGFLFPDTYVFQPDATAFDVLTVMLANFDRRVTPEMRLAAEAQGLSMFEAITLAAIVEREAVVPEERPVIASVYLNRLELGIKLDADPTVQYAVGQAPDWWKKPLTQDDLNFDSPYNTYVYPGLPRGPIANPGLSSIQAVIYSADTNYLYFRAACDGSGRHEFSETYEEHLTKGC